MLILRRIEDQWLEVRHKSGDVLRMRVMRLGTDPHTGKPSVELGFGEDGKAKNFQVYRPNAPFRRASNGAPLSRIERGLPPTQPPTPPPGNAD